MGIFDKFTEIKELTKEFSREVDRDFQKLKVDLNQEWIDQIPESKPFIELGKKIKMDTKNPFNPARLMNSSREYYKGDQIYINFCITHHGIYSGDNTVIHHSGTRIEEVSLEIFSKGLPIFTKNTYKKYDCDRIVSRARSQIGKTGYNLIWNNCEHFAEWCLNGD